MIQFFIKLANGWAGKIIFGSLLFGMVFVLGYGGLSSTSRLTDNAIAVGDQKLTMKELDDLFRKESQKLSGLMGGKYISPKEGIEMGLLDSVVQQETRNMIMNEVKSDLGLTASNHSVQKYVENNPVFADETGKFNRSLFQAYLSHLKMNEREMAIRLQDELASKHLLVPFSDLAYTPNELAKILYKYQNEKRNVSALLIETDKIELSQKPTEAELRDYYDVYAGEKFITPEYRSFSYVSLTPEMMLDTIKVSDQDIDRVYEERKSQFETPEKRNVSQLFFTDEDSAKKTYKALTLKNFEQKAKELGQTDEATNFGYIAQNELNEELAESVFNAKKDTLVGPIPSMTGWHILWVKDIKSAQAEPINQVRQKIKLQLAQEQTYDAKQKLLRELEDALGMGEKLSDAAQKLNIPVKTVTAIDVSGLKKDGKELSSEVKNTDLLQNLFTLEVGESTPFYERGNTTVVAELTEVVPVGTKSFDSVRPELVKIWAQNQQQEKLPQLVEDVIERVKNGSSLQAQGAFSHYKPFFDAALTRAGNDKFSPTVTQEIFNQSKGVSGIREIKVPNGVLITLVNDISYPTNQGSQKEKDALKAQMQELIASELIDGIMATYAKQVGVQVNQDAIQKTFSIYTTTQGE